MAAALATADAGDELFVWPDMVPAVSLFFGLQTQWRWVGAGMGGLVRTGIDYSALPTVAKGLDVEVTPEVLNDLRTLEAAAIAQFGRN